MKAVKLIIRTLICMVLFVPSYALLFTAFSFFGIVTIAGFISGTSGIIAIITNDEEWKEDAREGWYMFFQPFWLPLAVYYDYIKTGNLSFLKANGL